mmetsp:Transcript_14640/g.36560  ORF Transcript_14640/g.36560 Transcript_14640/m.36560 type:complete len:266 (-) Transcript_14640:2217-3014(-)
MSIIQGSHLRFPVPCHRRATSVQTSQRGQTFVHRAQHDGEKQARLQPRPHACQQQHGVERAHRFRPHRARQREQQSYCGRQQAGGVVAAVLQSVVRADEAAARSPFYFYCRCRSSSNSMLCISTSTVEHEAARDWGEPDELHRGLEENDRRHRDEVDLHVQHGQQPEDLVGRQRDDAAEAGAEDRMQKHREENGEREKPEKEGAEKGALQPGVTLGLLQEGRVEKPGLRNFPGCVDTEPPLRSGFFLRFQQLLKLLRLLDAPLRV